MMDEGKAYRFVHLVNSKGIVFCEETNDSEASETFFPVIDIDRIYLICKQALKETEKNES